MTKRKSISTRARFEIFKRDNFSCQYCGAIPPAVILHVDHIHPVSKGGDNSLGNLVTACNSCNAGKAAKLLTSVPQSLQEQALAIKEREKQLRAFNKMIREQKARIDAEVWEVVLILNPRNTGTVPTKEYKTIKMFIDKLGLFPVIEAAEIAFQKKRGHFKYFCGICWNKAKDGSRESA